MNWSLAKATEASSSIRIYKCILNLIPSLDAPSARERARTHRCTFTQSRIEHRPRSLSSSTIPRLVPLSTPLPLHLPVHPSPNPSELSPPLPNSAQAARRLSLTFRAPFVLPHSESFCLLALSIEYTGWSRFFREISAIWIGMFEKASEESPT